MRQIKRIPIIMKALEKDENKKAVLEYWFKPKVGTQMEIGMPYYDIELILKTWSKVNHEELLKIWQSNPDLRLSQLLVNTGILPNYPGEWYYREDERVVIKSKIVQPEDIMFWGNNYDINNKLLPETKWLLPHEMNTGHLKTLLNLHKSGDMVLSRIYIKIFKKELKKRRK